MGATVRSQAEKVARRLPDRITDLGVSLREVATAIGGSYPACEYDLSEFTDRIGELADTADELAAVAARFAARLDFAQAATAGDAVHVFTATPAARRARRPGGQKRRR